VVSELKHLLLAIAFKSSTTMSVIGYIANSSKDRLFWGLWYLWFSM